MIFNKPFFRADKRGDGVLELLVYSDIGENPWDGSGVTAADVKRQMDKAGSYSKILMRINSPGGDAFEGMAIHNLLVSERKPIDVQVDGIAASAASIVAMAGDTITMGTGAMMMIHCAWSGCIGNSQDMTKMADTLRTIDSSIAQIYVDSTGNTLADIEAWMEAETWMTADFALNIGFATGKAATGAENRALAMARNFRGLQNMKRVPAHLKKPESNLSLFEARWKMLQHKTYRPAAAKSSSRASLGAYEAELQLIDRGIAAA